MKFARYWMPVVLGIVLGGILAWRAGRSTLRESLATMTGAVGRTEKGSATMTASSSAQSGSDADRLGRVFAALQERRALKRRSELQSALGGLGSAELGDLIRKAHALRTARFDPRELSEAILQRWFEIDKAAATAWVRSRPDDESAWRIWAKADPEALLREAQGNRRPIAEQAVYQAASALAGGDPAKLAGLLLELPNSLYRDNILLGAAGELVRKDPNAALSFARNSLTGSLRAQALGVVFTGWIAKDFEAAMRVFPEYLSEFQSSEYSKYLIGQVADQLQKDPKRAVEWVNSLPASAQTPDAYFMIAERWARQDPVAALQWCADSFQSASGSVLRSALQANQEKTMAWILAQPPGEVRDGFLEQTLRMRSDLTAPASLGRDSTVVLAALNSLSPDAQAGASIAIGRQMIDSQSRLRGEMRGWLDKLRPELRSPTVMGAGEVFGGRSYTNPENYFMQFQAPAEVDAAIAGVAKGRSSQSPAEAAALAARIEQPELRWQTLDGFVVTWLRNQPAQAEAWLNASPKVSEEWKANWLAEVRAKK